MNNKINSELMSKMNSSFVYKALEWDYFTPYKIEVPNLIVAESNFKLPNWVLEKQDCKITICEDNFSTSSKVYTATIWWFNRGIKLVGARDEVKVLNECMELAEARLFELSTIFLTQNQ